jgi:hypothetical protein
VTQREECSASLLVASHARAIGHWTSHARSVTRRCPRSAGTLATERDRELPGLQFGFSSPRSAPVHPGTRVGSELRPEHPCDLITTPSATQHRSTAPCEVDSGRPAGISAGGFPRVASRTRRASHPGTGLSASPVMGVAVVIHPLAGHGAGMAAPR